MQEKYIVALIIIGLVAGLQVVAWLLHINGAVFNFTSLIIGSIAGGIFGFSLSSKASKK